MFSPYRDADVTSDYEYNKEKKTWQCRDEKDSLQGKEPAVRQTVTGR